MTKFLLSGLLMIFITQHSVAKGVSEISAPCRGHIFNILTDINWNGLLPITIGASTLVKGKLPDTKNPHHAICICPGDPLPKVGISLGYWEPMAIIDVTRTPYCLVNLSGKKIHNDDKREGTVQTQSPDQNSSFYYIHYYNLPVLRLIASELLGGTCQTDGEPFAPSYFSELDPTWNDEALAAIVFPETQWFQNPAVAMAAQTACTLDSLIANVSLPSDHAFWCAGSQGFMFPMTGTVAEHVGGVQASVLLSERAIFKLHQLGFITDTNANDLCREHKEYNMPKSRYRYQMIYPKKGPVQPFGRSTALWGANKEKPWEGDDAGYLIWRKRNCCNY